MSQELPGPFPHFPPHFQKQSLSHSVMWLSYTKQIRQSPLLLLPSTWIQWKYWFFSTSSLLALLGLYSIVTLELISKRILLSCTSEKWRSSQLQALVSLHKYWKTSKNCQNQCCKNRKNSKKLTSIKWRWNQEKTSLKMLLEFKKISVKTVGDYKLRDKDFQWPPSTRNTVYGKKIVAIK